MRRAHISPARRAVHIVGDLILLGWALFWLGVAGIVRAAINALAIPAVELGKGTTSLANTVDEAAEALGDVQFVGDQLAAPFRPIAESLRDIARQSVEQAAAVEQAALVAAVVVFLAPTLTLAVIYLPPRIRRARESAAVRKYIDDQADLSLFALRAMAKAPASRIAGITNDPVGAWRSADAATIQQLANLEFRRMGIGVAHVVDKPVVEHPR